MIRSVSPKQTLPNKIPRIAIVEPEQSTADCICEYLRKHINAWIISANSLQMLDLLQRHHFDLIISAVVQPGISGVVLCYEIKSEFPETKVVLTSKWIEPGLVEEYIGVNADFFFKKPIKLDYMLVVLKKLLGVE